MKKKKIEALATQKVQRAHGTPPPPPPPSSAAKQQSLPCDLSLSPNPLHLPTSRPQPTTTYYAARKVCRDHNRLRTIPTVQQVIHLPFSSLPSSETQSHICRRPKTCAPGKATE